MTILKYFHAVDYIDLSDNFLKVELLEGQVCFYFVLTNHPQKGYANL